LRREKEGEMYYVTMTDKFMSGWGMAKGRINKLIFPCDTYDEAEKLAGYAESRSDQEDINIRTTKPYYDERRYYAQVKTKAEYPTWYGID